MEPNELLGGYGMGMAVLNDRRPSQQADGLFAAVTGLKSGTGNKLQRSVSNVSRKSSKSDPTGVVLAGQQFVFMGDDASQSLQGNSNWGEATNLSRKGSEVGNKSHNSLFSMLNARNGLKRSVTTRGF